MGNRIDELQGQIKQGVGTLMGNEELEREGATQSERARLQREADGALDQAAGKVEEKIGQATGDTGTQAKGKARQAEGDIERAG
jgi:uncharacterized protein YjbJ (UPF0337 family)